MIGTPGGDLVIAINFAKIGRMLRYLKTHSSDETYAKVKKSYINLVIVVTIFCLIWLSIFTSGFAYLVDKTDLKITANNIAYEENKLGRVGDGIVWYTMNTTRYEIDISDFGYDIHDYEYGARFNIYVDENQHVVDIAPVVKSSLTGWEKDEGDLVIYWYISSLVLSVVTILILRQWMVNSKSKRNPAREWMTYFRWYDKNEIDGYWFAKDSKTYEQWYPDSND